MSRTLKERIERLEARHSRKAWRFILALCPEEEAGAITGYRAGNVTFLRLDNETADDCASRAFGASDEPFLVALYSHAGRYAPQGRGDVSDASTHGDALEAAHGAEIGPSDPWHLAGIGRTATREELERMGAIHVPPERLI